jgi:hypothetical protein
MMEQPPSDCLVEVCFTFGLMFCYVQIRTTAIRRCEVALIPSLTTVLREKLEIKFFENRVMRKTLGYRMYEVMEKWEVLCNDKLGS